MAHDIGRQIAIGKIAQGSLLPREAQLAERFDVSRQAIREALKVLAAKGMVVSRRRTGTLVQPRAAWNLLDPDVLAWHPVEDLPPALFEDLVELRRVVEPEAAALAATRRTEAELAEIIAAVAAMERLGDDHEAFNEADISFHLAVFTASGNALFQRLGLLMRPLLLASFHRQAEGRHKLTDVVRPHAIVAGAIARGDAAEARAEMARIIGHASFELGQTDVAVYEVGG